MAVDDGMKDKWDRQYDESSNEEGKRRRLRHKS